MNSYIGIDLGGTYIRFSYLKEGEKKFYGFKQIKLDSMQSEKAIIGFLENYIKLHKLHPKAICLGVPGLLNIDRSKILNVPNRKILKNIDFQAIFTKTFRCQFFLEKDVNLVLLKNIADLKTTETKDILLGFYVGTGFGHAMRINGKIFFGSHGISGEIGHIQLPGNKKRCPCGKIGCVETTYSGLALEKYAKKKYKNSDIRDVFQYYEKDEYLQKFVKGMAWVMSMSIAILDPRLVLIGGGIVNMKNFPQEELKKELLELIRIPEFQDRVKVLITKNSQENGTYGAAMYASQQM